MNGVAGPVKTLSITVWRVKYLLKFLDTFCRTAQSEDAFDIGSCEEGETSALIVERNHSKASLTFLFQKNSAFSHYNGDVAVDETFPSLVC